MPKSGLENYTTQKSKWFDDDILKRYGAAWDEIKYDNLTDSQKKMYEADKKTRDQLVLMQEHYNEGVADVEKNRSTDLQNAYINSQLAQKYLPMYLKKAGIDNLGIAQSTVSELGTNYGNLVAGINKAQDQEISALRDAYNTSMLDTQALHQTDIDSVKSANSANALAFLEDAFAKVNASGGKGVSHRDYSELKKAYSQYIDDVVDPLEKQRYEKLMNSIYATDSVSKYNMTNPTLLLDDIYSAWERGWYEAYGKERPTGLFETLDEIEEKLNEALNSHSIEPENYNVYMAKLNKVRNAVQKQSEGNAAQKTNTKTESDMSQIPIMDKNIESFNINDKRLNDLEKKSIEDLKWLKSAIEIKMNEVGSGSGSSQLLGRWRAALQKVNAEIANR